MNGWRVYQYTLTPMDTSGLIGLLLYVLLKSICRDILESFFVKLLYGFVEKYFQGFFGKYLYGFVEK